MYTNAGFGVGFGFPSLNSSMLLRLNSQFLPYIKKPIGVRQKKTKSGDSFAYTQFSLWNPNFLIYMLMLIVAFPLMHTLKLENFTFIFYLSFLHGIITFYNSNLWTLLKEDWASNGHFHSIQPVATELQNSPYNRFENALLETTHAYITVMVHFLITTWPEFQIKPQSSIFLPHNEYLHMSQPVLLRNLVAKNFLPTVSHGATIIPFQQEVILR